MSSSWQFPFLCSLGSITQLAPLNPPTNGEEPASPQPCCYSRRPGIATSSLRATTACCLLPSVPFHLHRVSCEKHTTHVLNENQTPSTVEALCALPNLTCTSVHLGYLLPAQGVTFHSQNVPSLLHSHSNPKWCLYLEALPHHSYTSADFLFFRNQLKSHPCIVTWPTPLE